MEQNSFRGVVVGLLLALSCSGQYIDWVKQIKNKPFVDVREFGAKGDGVTDDYAAFAAALTHGGRVFVPKGTYKVNTMLDVDAYTTLLEGEQGVVIDVSGNSTINSAAFNLFATGTYGEQSQTKTWTGGIKNISFKSNPVKTMRCGYIGKVGSEYQQSHDLVTDGITCWGFYRGFEFLENAWRWYGNRVGMGNIRLQFIMFDGPANAGEVMECNHCFFENGTYGASLYLNYGQWTFNGMSFPAGGDVGLVYAAGAANVTLDKCNLETQPQSADHILVWVRESANLVLTNSTVILNEDDYSSPLFQVDDNARLAITNSTLPLYDYVQNESTNGIRSLTTGTSTKVLLRNNVTYGGGLTDQTKWSVVSGVANVLRNPDAERGNLEAWHSWGTGTPTITATHYKNGTKGFLLTATSGQAVQLEQRIPVSEATGRMFVLGMWAKLISGAGSTLSYPQVRFYDQHGNWMTNYSSIVIPDTLISWTWLGASSFIPVGTAYLGVYLTAENVASGVTVAFDDITLNIM